MTANAPFMRSAGWTPTISIASPVNKLPSGMPPRVASMKRLTVCPRSRGLAPDWRIEFADVLLMVIAAPAMTMSGGNTQNQGTSAANDDHNPVKRS